MSNKAYSSFGLLRAAVLHSKGLSSASCSTMWKNVSIPSMLYGCGTWGNLPQKELLLFEVGQNRVGRHILGLHKRTHNEVVRDLYSWLDNRSGVEGLIRIFQLNFFRKLLDLYYNLITTRARRLVRKGAPPYLRVHPLLVPHVFLKLERTNMEIKPALLNTVKLLSYVECCDMSVCNYCLCQYVDTVKHYIMDCEYWTETRL